MAYPRAAAILPLLLATTLGCDLLIDIHDVQATSSGQGGETSPSTSSVGGASSTSSQMGGSGGSAGSACAVEPAPCPSLPCQPQELVKAEDLGVAGAPVTAVAINGSVLTFALGTPANLLAQLPLTGGQPTVLANLNESPHRLAADATGSYFLSPYQACARRVAAGATVETPLSVCPLVDNATYATIGLTDSLVYWLIPKPSSDVCTLFPGCCLGGQPGCIVAGDREKDTPSVVVGGKAAIDFTLANGALYWTATQGQTTVIERCKPGGTPCEPETWAVGVSTLAPQRLTFAGDSIYWGNANGGIRFAPISDPPGGAGEPFTTTNAPVVLFASDQEALYFTIAGNGIFRADLGQKNTAVLLANAAPTSIAVDCANVYFAVEDRVLRVAKKAAP